MVLSSDLVLALEHEQANSTTNIVDCSTCVDADALCFLFVFFNLSETKVSQLDF